jgi:hypothetical protein
MLDPQHLLWTQIAAGVCLLIFAGQLFNLFQMRSQMRAAASWEMTEGVITVSRVDQPPSHVSDVRTMPAPSSAIAIMPADRISRATGSCSAANR